MIRKATKEDIDAISALYEKAISYEEEHTKYTSWKRGVYPTAKTASDAIENETMYVFSDGQKLLASVILDTLQPKEYACVQWLSPQKGERLVIHTLCVDPTYAGGGIASALLDLAKAVAKERGLASIRLNTSSHNHPALSLYKKNGFSELAGYSILLDGKISCRQVFLEYVVE